MTSAVAPGVPRWLRLLPALLAAVAALLLLPAAPASAHAVLVSSDPADGSRVEAAPSTVRLVFDEPVTMPPDAVVVLSATGDRGDRGPARLSADGRTVVVPLRGALPPGVYDVAYRLVSADSHVVTGSIRFGVRRDADAVDTVAGAGAPLDPAVGAATGVEYLGLALGIGVPAAAATLWPSVRGRRRVTRTAAVGLVVLALASVADLLLRALRSAGGDLSGLLRLEGLGYTAASGVGLVLLARLVLVALLAVLVLRRPEEAGRGRTAAAGVVAVAVLTSVALLGHATDGAWWLLVPAAVLHLAAMVLWLGGLVVLAAAVLPRAAPEAGLRSLRRWSVVAFACVAVLVVTGEVQAFPTVAPLDGLWSTRYGVLLLVKLAVLAGVLVLAAVAQRLVARSARPSRVRLRRAIAAEVVGVLVVLGVTAGLSSTATAAETYGPAVTRQVAAGPDELVVAVDRTRRGPAVIRVRAVDGAGRPVRLAALDGSLGTAEVSALDVAFRRDGDGWRSAGAALPVAGEWTLTLHAETSDEFAYAAAVAWPVW